jgi:hypothetical protein
MAKAAARLAQPAARARDDDDFSFEVILHVAFRVPLPADHFVLEADASRTALQGSIEPNGPEREGNVPPKDLPNPIGVG